jgi:hypothetical protein
MGWASACDFRDLPSIATAIRSLAAERDMWRGENIKKQTACEQMGARIAAFETEIEKLRAALDFYACLDHYQTHNAVAPNVVQFDRGAKARAALGEKQ